MGVEIDWPTDVFLDHKIVMLNWKRGTIISPTMSSDGPWKQKSGDFASRQ